MLFYNFLSSQVNRRQLVMIGDYQSDNDAYYRDIAKDAKNAAVHGHSHTNEKIIYYFFFD